MVPRYNGESYVIHKLDNMCIPMDSSELMDIYQTKPSKSKDTIASKKKYHHLKFLTPLKKKKFLTNLRIEIETIKDNIIHLKFLTTKPIYNLGDFLQS